MKLFRAGSAAIALLLAACHASSPAQSQIDAPGESETQASQPLVAAARRQIGVTRLYDPAYVEMFYPGGDVPADRGVCTDVLVRALRADGLDLQQVVHEDMRSHSPTTRRTGV